MTGDQFTDNDCEPFELWPGGVACCGCGLMGVDLCEPCDDRAAREHDAWVAAENARLRTGDSNE